MQIAVIGPLHGDWWRLFTHAVRLRERHATRSSRLLTIAIFGWLIERRHGPAVVLGAVPRCGGGGRAGGERGLLRAGRERGERPALALLAAWALPTCCAARAGDYYEGDLLGAGAFAALLLAVPFAVGGELAGGRGRRCDRAGRSVSGLAQFGESA